MSIQLESTTDSREQVLAAIGGAKSSTVKDEQKAVSSRDDESQQDKSEQEESETSEENLNENDDSDSSASEDDEEIKDDLKEDQKPKKRSGFQRRIDKFQKKLSERDQEIEQLRKAVASGAGKPLEQSAPENTQQQKTEAIGKPDPNNFDSHQDYVEALTDWKIEEKDRDKEVKAKEAQFKTEYQKQVSTFQSKVAEFSKATPDFNDVISDVDDIPLRDSIQDAILTSDLGPLLMYELSKNRDELLRINSLSPLAAAREIGKLEAKISQGQEATKPKEAKLTKTPPPLEPVGSKSSGKNFKSPDEMSFGEYKAWRNKK